MRRTIALPTDRLSAHVDEGVGWITFDDPDRHNALSQAMVESIPAACDAMSSDEDVRVVVLRGAGEEAFVSGGNLAEIGERTAEPGKRRRPPTELLTAIGADRLLRLDKPVIAMLRGWCLGGGVLMALCADIRIAADDLQIGIPAARLGLAYPYEAVEMLLRVVGPSAAAEILFTGERYDAEVARRMGLVNIVAPADDLEGRTRSLAGSIAANAPLSLVASKAALRAAMGERGAAQAHERIADVWASADAQEGLRAFREKRPPRFLGN